MPQQCPFCHFINKKPDDLWIIEETENFYAWLEYPEPRAKGQTNIVPKDHKESVLEFTESEWNEAMALLRKTVQRVDQGLGADGVSVTMNINKVGGQIIPHAYIQVFPRFENEENAGTPTGAIFRKREDLQDDKIFENVQSAMKSVELGSGAPPKQKSQVTERQPVSTGQDSDEENEEEEESENNKSAKAQWKEMKKPKY